MPLNGIIVPALVLIDRNTFLTSVCVGKLAPNIIDNNNNVYIKTSHFAFLLTSLDFHFSFNKFTACNGDMVACGNGRIKTMFDGHHFLVHSYFILSV